MERDASTSWWSPPLSSAYTRIRLLGLNTSDSICDISGLPFWVPWDSDRDDVNSCFEDVTLPLCCLALLLTVTPWVSRAAFAAHSSQSHQQPSRLDAVRLLLIALCGVLPMAFLIGSVTVQSLFLFREQQLYLFLSVLFFLFFFFLQHFASRRGAKQHPCLRLSLTVHFILQILKLQSAVRRWQQQGGGAWGALLSSDVEAAVLLLPELFLCIVFCVFSSDAEASQGEEPFSLNAAHSSPEASASFLGLLTFSWMYPLISKGNKQQLQAADTYELMPHDTTQAQTEAVLAAWEAEEAAARGPQCVTPETSSGGPPSHAAISTQASDTSALLLSQSERERSSSDTSSSSSSSSRIRLFRVLCKTYGSTCLGSALLKIVHDLLQFVGPVVLQQIILFLQQSADKSREPPAHVGLLYCFILFVANTTQTMVLHQYFHRQFRMGMRLRVAVSALIYRKAFKIQVGAPPRGSDEAPAGNAGASSSGKGGRTTGQYVNLLAVDCQRLQDLMAYIHLLWSAPLQICIALVLLFRLLGLAAFGGLAVMLLNGPVTGFIGRQATRMQRRLMDIRDERSTATTELLSGIKAVKMYAWENSFFARISAIRERELCALRAYWQLMVASRTQWLAAPLGVSIATFACYVVFHGDLDASTAFTAMALFNILRFPMQLLPMTTNNILEARVALGRIQAFLDQEEAQGLPPLADKTAEEAPSGATGAPAAAPSLGFVGEGEGGSEGDRRDKHKKKANKEKENKEIKDQKELPAIEVMGASFAWPNGTFLLRDISFQCKKGELVAVVGPTGSGKSGLLLSLLGSTKSLPSRRGVSRVPLQEAFVGELLLGKETMEESRACLRGSVAYCSQVPWIQSATLRENVLFGRECDESWYYQVLEACALLPDISLLPGGDETEIGERGINLSGGQKQRVALARAVYRLADIYLLDDCLSAVDVHVAQHIFENCFKSLLREKAVLLVSNRLAVLPGCDSLLFLSKGTQRFFGRLQEARKLEEFNAFAATSERSDKEENWQETGDGGDARPSGVQTAREGLEAEASTNSMTVGQRKAAGALTDEETVQSGAVPFRVYAEYFAAAGGLCGVCLSVAFLLFGSLLLVLSNVWLSSWADHKVQTDTRLSLGIFAALGAAHIFVTILAYLKVSSGAVAAARYYHQRLLRSILDAPMSFFDSTSSGRLMNRLTKSIYGIDEALPSALLSYIINLLACLMTISVITFVFPFFLIIVLPLLCYYSTIQNFYIPTSRQLQRIEAISRSPVFSHFQETIEGTETIRAYRDEERFIATAADKINYNSRIYYMSIAANRWLAVRLEMVGTAVVISSALFSIIWRGYISGGLGGLAVSYALSITQHLNWLVRMASDRETNIVSVERVHDYSEGVEPERLEPSPAAPVAAAAGAAAASPVISWRERVPEGWPRAGVISVKGLCVRYRPDLPLVLKSVSFDVCSGEKVGLVGRTGAGKSSLLVSLLRLVEPSEGVIEIDGVDIQSVGLRFLRSRFSIIPQDPVLFAGSLRFNIDAQGEHTDAEIWQALEGAHLASAVRAMAAGMRRNSSSRSSSSSRIRAENVLWEEDDLETAMLPAAAATDIIGIEIEPQIINPLDMTVEEGGRNFSLGQRQLICLARALLRRSRILLLDEATAVVDPRTDRLIQETIRTDFKDCTVITIAHRIDTIVDYDRVLVLAEGQVEEFDSPRVLYEKKDSFFRSLCLQAGVQPGKA